MKVILRTNYAWCERRTYIEREAVKRDGDTVKEKELSKEIADLSDEEAALQLYQDAKALKKEGILLDRKNSTNFIKTSKWYSIIDVNTIPDNIRNKGDYYYLKKTNQPDVPLIDLVSKHTWIDLKSYIKDTSSNLLAAGIDSPNQIDLQPLLTIHPDLLKNIVNP